MMVQISMFPAALEGSHVRRGSYGQAQRQVSHTEECVMCRISCLTHTLSWTQHLERCLLPFSGGFWSLETLRVCLVSRGWVRDALSDLHGTDVSSLTSSPVSPGKFEWLALTRQHRTRISKQDLLILLDMHGYTWIRSEKKTWGYFLWKLRRKFAAVWVTLVWNVRSLRRPNSPLHSRELSAQHYLGLHANDMDVGTQCSLK